MRLLFVLGYILPLLASSSLMERESLEQGDFNLLAYCVAASACGTDFVTYLKRMAEAVQAKGLDVNPFIEAFLHSHCVYTLKALVQDDTEKEWLFPHLEAFLEERRGSEASLLKMTIPIYQYFFKICQMRNRRKIVKFITIIDTIEDEAFEPYKASSLAVELVEPTWSDEALDDLLSLDFCISTTAFERLFHGYLERLSFGETFQLSSAPLVARNAKLLSCFFDCSVANSGDFGRAIKLWMPAMTEDLAVHIRDNYEQSLVAVVEKCIQADATDAVRPGFLILLGAISLSLKPDLLNVFLDQLPDRYFSIDFIAKLVEQHPFFHKKAKRLIESAYMGHLTDKVLKVILLMSEPYRRELAAKFQSSAKIRDYGKTVQTCMMALPPTCDVDCFLDLLFPSLEPSKEFIRTFKFLWIRATVFDGDTGSWAGRRALINRVLSVPNVFDDVERTMIYDCVFTDSRSPSKLVLRLAQAICERAPFKDRPDLVQMFVVNLVFVFERSRSVRKNRHLAEALLRVVEDMWDDRFSERMDPLLKMLTRVSRREAREVFEAFWGSKGIINWL